MNIAFSSSRRLFACLASGILAAGAFSISSHAQMIPIYDLSTTGVLGLSGSASAGIANLTDGNFSDTSYQEWLGAGSATLDLGSVQMVDRLVVAMRPVGDLPVLSQGYVETSIDGVSWTRVKDFDNSGAVSSGNILALGFHAQQARYVRFTMDTPDLHVQVGELLVYNGGGPRVSLMSRGPDTSWNVTNGTVNPVRTPFNLVDGDWNTFGLFNATAGEITLRLDSVEYDNGWSSISIGIRGNKGAGGPNNPSYIEVFVGDGAGNWSSIFSDEFDPITSVEDILLEMDSVRHEKYIRIAFDRRGFAAPNFQFREIDVIPVPEASGIALGAAGLAMLVALKRGKKHG